MIKLIFKIISPTLSAMILFFLTSWLFGKVDVAQPDKTTRIPIRLSSQKPVLPKNSKPAEQKPAKTHKTKAKHIGQEGRSSDKIPVIRIYYGKDDIKNYVKFLASYGCIFLVQTGSGNLFAEYEPSSGFLAAISKKDLRGYSPRTRILARYGESRYFDLIIQKAVSLDTNLNSPETCHIIAVVSHYWENSLLNAIINLANTNRLKMSGIASADISFKGGRFILMAVLTDAGAKHEIGQSLHF